MSCGLGKVNYVNERDALCACVTLLERARFMGDLQTYFCQPCGRWHLKTAKVQLHDWLWRPVKDCPKRVRTWFQQRGTIDMWDSE